MRIITGVLAFLITLSVQAQQINEICSSNHSCWENGSDTFPDWVELQNTSAGYWHLSGWVLTPDPGDGHHYTFESGGVMPGAFHVVEFSHEIASFFNLPKEGGSLYLLNPEGDIVDRVVFPDLERDHSYGRIAEEWYYFETPTPSLSNDSSIGYKGYASVPTSNRVSGTYQSGTHIVLRGKLNEESIFFQLNGRQPAQLFSAPIVLSETTTITTFSSADSLLDSPKVTYVYQTGESRDLPVIHLTVDSLDFWDEETGIYVEGPNAEADFPHYGANYWQDWEVEAHYAYFDVYGNCKETLPCAVKIHGGAGSRIRPMKSLQLRAKKSMGNDMFEHAYFSDKPINEFKRLVLRNSGNDFCNSCMKDAVLHRYFMRSDLNVDLLAYQPVEVYINGVYWGLHNLREKADRYYVSANHGVDPDKVNLLENWSLIPSSGSAESFEALRDYAENEDLTVDVHFNWVADRLDIPSFVDYFLVELFVNNRDWPNYNIKVWNSESHPKWRYICYDLDASFRYADDSPEAKQNLSRILTDLGHFNPHVVLLKQLLDNQDFRSYFVNRYADLLNTVFDHERMIEAYRAGKAEVEKAMEPHYEKWCGAYEDWEKRFGGIEGFLQTRVPIARDEVTAVFDLNEQANVTVNTYPLRAGTVQLNTLNLTSFPFSGVYYATNTIRLTAKPAEGYQFAYWENERTGERFFDSVLTIDPVDNDAYVAVFLSAATPFNLSVYPNPVGRRATIAFALLEATRVDFSLTSLSGQTIQPFKGGRYYSMGGHEILQDFSQLPDGIYVLTLNTPEGKESITFKK